LNGKNARGANAADENDEPIYGEFSPGI